MSGFKVNFSVNNQLATPSIHAAALANRPAAGQVGRVFIDTDNPSTGIYRDTGTAWVQIAQATFTDTDTLQTVTDRGNTTTNSVSIGTASAPSATLDVHGSGVIAILQGTGTNDSFLQFNKSGNGKFKVGNVHNSGNDYFTVYNLQENSDAILVNISTNNVAIGGGTVTPTYKLDITGSLRNTGNAYFATTSGNVGIGTTSPAYKLDVVGNARISNLNAATTLFLGQGGIYDGRLDFGNTSINQSSGPILNLSSGTGVMDFYSNFVIRQRIFSNGNIAIGTTTDSGYKLDIRGQTYIDVGVGTNPILRMRTNNATNNWFYGNAASALTWSANFAVDGTLTIGNGISAASGRSYDFNSGTFNNVNVINMTSNATITFRPDLNVTGAKQGAYIYPTNDTFDEGVIQVWNAAETSCRFIVKSLGQIGIGTNNPNANAILDITSTTKGVKFPSMTTAEKNAIANTVGLVVFDTTLAKLCVNSGAGWETITSV